MHIERKYGSLDATELHLRWILPVRFCEWQGLELRFSWSRAMNPLNWFRRGFCRSNWRLFAKYRRGINHRCYCDSGALCDGCVMVGGFGLQWFWSRYDGPSPCCCDNAISEMWNADDGDNYE